VLAKKQYEYRVQSSQRGRSLVRVDQRRRESNWAFDGRRLLFVIQTSPRFIFRHMVLQKTVNETEGAANT
jgi:hypothetical protein